MVSRYSNQEGMLNGGGDNGGLSTIEKDIFIICHLQLLSLHSVVECGMSSRQGSILFVNLSAIRVDEYE